MVVFNKTDLTNLDFPRECRVATEEVVATHQNPRAHVDAQLYKEHFMNALHSTSNNVVFISCESGEGLDDFVTNLTQNLKTL